MNELARGRFEVLRLCGAGAAGWVYEALDRSRGERVALKVLKNEVDRGRFAREVAALARIRSAHVVALRDFGVDDDSGRPWLAMELLDGWDLATCLAAGVRLSPRSAARVVAQACAGLAAAHEAGVVHRDLKPSNVFLARTQSAAVATKLIDFGLAARHAGRPTTLGATGATRHGALLGSPRYMAPEQARGSVANDPRVDVYALGVVLYECVVGIPLYPAALGFGELLLRIATEAAPRLGGTEIDTLAPPELVAIVDRALAFDPSRRFASANSMRVALVDWLGDAIGLSSAELSEIAPRATARAPTRPAATIGADLLPGAAFGDYEVLATLGRGGMGVVYRARDRRLERTVALKVLNIARTSGESRDFAPTGGTLTGGPNLLREARAAARIAHPNAISVYDAGDVGGAPFIAMEVIAGTTIRGLLRGEASMAERIRWITDVARVLAAAHERGIVHGDIKPENVMVRAVDGAIKVLDFGIARSVLSEGEGSMSVGGGAAGTPAYMAPEQLRGSRATASTDQFSWAVFAYEALTGSLPWSSDDIVATVRDILMSPMPSLADAVGPTHRAADAAIARAMSKESGARYADMRDVVRALARDEGPSRGNIARRQRRSSSIRQLVSHAAAAAGIVVGLGSDVPLAAGHSSASFETASADSEWPLFGSAPSHSEVAMQAFREGMSHLRAAEGDRARAALTMATDIDPDFAAAHLRAVFVTPHIGDVARTHVAKAISRRTSLGAHDRLLLHTVEPLLAIPVDMEETLQRVDRLAGASDADYQDASCWFHMLSGRDSARAITACERASHLAPDAARPLWLAGESAVAAYDITLAQSYFSECIHTSSDSTSCLHSLTQSYFRQGRCSEALPLSLKLATAAPDSPVARQTYGTALYALGGPTDEVSRFVETAASLTSDDGFGTAFGRARFAIAQGEFDNARTILREVAAAAPSPEIGWWATELRGCVEVELESDVTAAAEYRHYKESLAGLENGFAAWDFAIDATAELYVLGALSRLEFERARDAWLRRHDPAGRIEGTLSSLESYWLAAYARPTLTERDAREALEAMPRFNVRAPRPQRASSTNLTIGNVYRLAGDTELAIAWYRASVRDCDRLSDPFAYLHALLALGDLVAPSNRAEACDAYRRIVDRWGKSGAVTARKAAEHARSLGCSLQREPAARPGPSP